MEKCDVLEKIIRLAQENSDAESIEEDSSFMDDLEMSSMEIYSFVGELEDELNISIPQRVLNQVATVGELADEVLKLV